MIPSAPFDQTQPATAYSDAGEGDRVADRASTYAYDTNGRLSVIHPTDRAPLRFNDGRPTPSTSTIPHGHRRLSAEPDSSDDDHSATSIPETARPGIYTYDASPRTCAPPRCAATDPLPFTARNARALAPRHDYGATTISLWLSRDPIGERGGANVYSFVGNDSVNYVDLLGWARTGYRPLGDGKAPIVTEPEGSIADKFNFELNHEHFFFDDGKDLFGNPVPADLANVGYGPVGNLPQYPDSGAFSEDASTRNYKYLGLYYDDDLLRKAIINVLNTGAWRADKYDVVWDFDDISKRNCQDFAKAVRDEYDRLRGAIELQRQMQDAAERLKNNGRVIPTIRRRY